MNENRNIPGIHLSDRLPVHSPDDNLWGRVSSGLDNLEVQQIYEGRLQDLPVHQPDGTSWQLLLARMQRARIVKIGGYSLLGIAATLLLFFSIFRLPENKLNTIQNISAVGKGRISQPRNTKSSSPSNPGKDIYHSASPSNPTSPGTLMAGNEPKRSRNNNDHNIILPDRNTGNLAQATSIQQSSTNKSINRGNSLIRLTPRTIEQAALNLNSLQRKPSKPRQIIEPVVLAAQTPVKYYTPEPYNPKKKKGNSFELSANYLPESLENGYGTSMFHNVGLMASVENEKNRIQSSLGMAYNAEHRTYDVDYTQFIPITVTNPTTTHDSTILMEAKGTSKLDGTEKHQYITYDLGVGRKLFNLGKMSTWFNTGAGFAVKLDQASLKETTIKTINNHNNSMINSLDLQIPDYNKININIMAGLDFNYAVMSRLIISFAPTSRFYLKPVLVKDGSSTDSFSLGFRSGVKFKF
jgi:hypothetical protein